MILILRIVMCSLSCKEYRASICSIRTHKKTMLLLLEELCSAKETEDENSRRED